MISRNIYHCLLSWSLVLSEDEVLGLGVDGDVHGVPGAGDQGALAGAAVLALLTIAGQTFK